MTSTQPRGDRATANLPSRDLDTTEAFYGAFGFERVHRDDGWLILVRGTIELEFFLFTELDPLSSSAMCCVRVADVDGLYAAIAASGIPEGTQGFPRLHPVVPQSWGLRSGALIDLDGTQLTLIGEPRRPRRLIPRD